MASTVTTQKAKAAAWRYFYDFDPDATGATDVGWADFRDYGYALMAFFRTVGTGALTVFNILANPESGGSGTDVTVKEHGVASEPNATGDFIWLECLASEVRILGANLRYLSASLHFETDTDEGVVYYEFGQPRFARLDLTADVIS